MQRSPMDKKQGNPGGMNSSAWDRSPFGIPPVTSFYPLEDSEKEAIERVLREYEAQRQHGAAKQA
jgi:hypothetical protein